jgi:hypothetical protein
MKQALYRLDGQKDDDLLTSLWTSKGDRNGGATYRGNFLKIAIFLLSSAIVEHDEAMTAGLP